jgi:hypothetical protein
MSLEKSEIKCAVIHEFGNAMDDALEAAAKDVHLAQGAHAGLLQTEKKVAALAVHVDKDLDEGKLDLDSSLEIAKIIKVYIQRAVAVVHSDAMSYEQRVFMAQGRMSAFEQNVKLAKKMYDMESRKADAVREAESDPSKSNGQGRHVGVRPAATIKQQRLAEEEAGRLTGETKPKAKPKAKRTRKAAAPKATKKPKAAKKTRKVAVDAKDSR